MIAEHSLSTFRDYVAHAFKAGTEHFPHYTLHGKEHLDELDRLALMIRDAIPKLHEREDRFQLLRLALIIHDLAMVKVPTPDREAVLREQMNADVSFADIVRKTHQDEVANSLAEPGLADFLTGTFTDSDPHELEEAVIVAKHHRFHPLEKAPEHLQDLCALMRLIDELDIGPKRAPRPAYDALRPRMDRISKFHWLKHMCTRAIERDPTFTVVERNGRRVLEIHVAVKATADTWQKLQQAVYNKIRHCLHHEGVKSVIKDRLGVEFEVHKAAEYLCGETAFLPGVVKEDLAEHVAATPVESTPESENSAAETDVPEPAGDDKPQPSFSRDHEFPIFAIPPEDLPETLCRCGRLTVIDNEYVPHNENHLGGVPDAPSRVYVGPADCGKTRAAAEWIARLTADRANAWVVLRTDIGTIPADIKNIRLDTSFYEQQRFQLPQRAILFLDDLPRNLPQPAAMMSPTDAVRHLFQWFEHQPYFHERRVVGTMRAEDMHARPDWPDVLPSLGQPLELVSVKLDTPEQYAALWKGFARGAIYPSTTVGKKPFALQIEQTFIDKVLERPADPEAVAMFILQSAKKGVQRLDAEDAASYSASAVETWLQETWPVLLNTYGPAAQVFFTLARFLAAGLRPDSGYKMSLTPDWDYHAAFGPEMCELVDCSGNEYLTVLDKMISDGHAIGERNQSVIPKWDFLLQAEALPGVEVKTPSPDWFAERSVRLKPEHRRSLAGHFSYAGVTINTIPEIDHEWHLGWGAVLTLRADDSKESNARRVLFDAAIQSLREAVRRIGPNSSEVLEILRGCHLLDAAGETDQERSIELWKQLEKSAREIIGINPNSDRSWTDLGVSLGQQADAESDPTRKAELRQQAIDANRSAVQANPQKDQAWHNLGVSLGQQADAESDPTRKAELRQQAIDAYRSAVQANPQKDQAWYNLGVRLGQQADAESDPTRKAELRQQAIDANRSAVQANPQKDQAWYNLANSLIHCWRVSADSEVLNEALEASRHAADLGGGRYNFACALALSGQTNEAFDELQGCLARNEISAEHVEQDADWDGLRDDPRYAKLIAKPPTQNDEQGDSEQIV